MSRGALTWWARATAAAALVATGLLAAPGAMACACGGFVGPDGSRQTVQQETAALHWDGTDETIHLRLTTQGVGDDAGLLLPTPNPAADVALGDEELFSDLAAASAPRWEERQHLFGPPELFGDAGDSAAGGAPGDGAVQVLSTQDLGPLETAVLTADDPGALDEWLTEHDYVMNERFESVVTPYVEEGWAFVAVRLTAEGQTISGDLPPLKVTFPSDELVYPMRMSQAAVDTQSTRTYVLSDHRVTRTDPTGSSGQAKLLFAGELTADQAQSPELAAIVAQAPYLTTLEQEFVNPQAQIVSDYVFAADDTDEPFQRVIYTDSYLIPIDVAIILAVLVLGLVGGGIAIVMVVRRQLRSAPRAS